MGLLDGMFNINLILIAAVRVLQDSPTGHQHHGGQHYGQRSLQRKSVQSISINSSVITWQAATVPVPTRLAYRTLQVGASNTSTHTCTSGKRCTTQISQATTTQAGDQPGEPTLNKLAACPPTCKQPSLTRLLKAALVTGSYGSGRLSYRYSTSLYHRQGASLLHDCLGEFTCWWICPENTGTEGTCVTGIVMEEFLLQEG